MSKKLSPSQRKVVECLQSNPNYYVRAQRYYHWQYVHDVDGRKIMSFWRPTREWLVDNKILIPAPLGKDLFILNPNASFRYAQWSRKHLYATVR